MPRVPKSPSAPQVPECPSPWVYKYQVPWMPKCRRSLWVRESLRCSSARSPKFFECPSAQVLFKCPKASSARVPKCPWSVLGVLFKCSSALLVPLECPLSALLVKKVCSITGNGVLNSFIKTLQNTYSTWHLLLHNTYFCFLGNNICKLYHVLLARYSHSKGF